MSSSKAPIYVFVRTLVKYQSLPSGLFLRAGGVKVDFTSSFGIIAIIKGGLSSALWGSLASISYHQSSFKQILKDFFKSKRQFINYCLVLVFVTDPFYLLSFGGKITTQSLVLLQAFFKALLLVELKKLPCFLQPTLQENIPIFSYLITFSLVQRKFTILFYIDGSLGVIQLFPFLVGLLTNCFIYFTVS